MKLWDGVEIAATVVAVIAAMASARFAGIGRRAAEATRMAAERIVSALAGREEGR